MEKSPSKPNLDWVSVSLIVPNPVNPNRMTEEAFRAYVAEVRRLGRLPKPIVVRSKGKEFQIVDGEHGWKAAKEVGLTEVLVEVIEADDYELEVQCFKRNRGGRDDPVLLGQMFERMKNEKGCSNYELGADLGKSEGWVRVYLRYAEAARLRSTYAGEDRGGEVAKLSQRQLHTYLTLPQEIGNPWLDSGGDLYAWDAFPDDHTLVATRIRDAGLAFLLSEESDG